MLLYIALTLLASTTLCPARVFPRDTLRAAGIDERSFIDLGLQTDWHYTEAASLLVRDDSTLEECSYICSANTGCGSYGTCPAYSSRRKRALSDSFAINEDYNATGILGKRQLTNAPANEQNNIGSYLDAQSAKITDAGRIVPAVGSRYETFSFCIQQEFSRASLIDGQFLAGTADTLLEGCSVLTIVSKRAVYMCHFFEDLNYYSGKQGRKPDTPEDERIRKFEGFGAVLNLITGNRRAIARKSIAGASLDVSLFNQDGDETSVFYMTPRKLQRTPDTIKYEDDKDSLYALLMESGVLPDARYIAPYAYALPPKKNAKPWQGVALFEWDQNYDGKNNANWRLWFEQAREVGPNWVGEDVEMTGT